MIIEKMTVGQLQANSYIVGDEDSKEVILIDPGAEGEMIYNKIQECGYNVKYIVLTHGHGDHISAVNFLRERCKAQVAVHTDDEVSLSDSSRNLSYYLGQEIVIHDIEIILKDNDELNVGNIKYKVIHTPGHSPGSICILGEDKLFSGDTLFKDSIGRTDLPGGNFNTITKSIKEKLYFLEDNIEVFPGHGENTTIGYEKKNNSFVRA